MSYKVLVVTSEPDDREELLEMAWGIIANAYGGEWDQAPPNWRQAARTWRLLYHELLKNWSA